MRKVKWHVYSKEDHDAKIAKHLRKLLLKVYKYAAKHGLWEVRLLVTNDASVEENALKEDVECYAEVSALCYNAIVVDDAASLPIIEEPK